VRDATLLSEGRLVSLYRQAVHCERHGVPGAFVECGVWKGGAVALMALANLRHGRARRPLHLFDAFQDVPEPEPTLDGERAVAEARRVLGKEPTGALRPMQGFYDAEGGAGSAEGNRTLLVDRVGYDPAHVHLHEGWFQETVPRVSEQIGPIAILRLDGDYYHSVKVCLEHLVPQVVSGGFVVVDDYGYYEGCTRAVDEFIADSGLPLFLHPADHATPRHAYFQKPPLIRTDSRE
jgi:hypothetical protein